MSGDIIVALVVVIALGFDFTNGFHDTANAMATTIATGALKPKVAVTVAAILNFVGAFISLKVAATVAGGIVDRGRDHADRRVRRPGRRDRLESRHVVVRLAVVVVACADRRCDRRDVRGGGQRRGRGGGVLSKVIVPAVCRRWWLAWSPRSACSSSTGSSALRAERAERAFRWAQVASSSMVALAHGTNDAQKTMGVISLALIANGNISGGDNFDVPTWVVVSCATAIALGTYMGGWRIIKTLGTKVVEVRPPQGFGSEAVAATVILASSHVGYPLSTTQVVSGAVTGSGVGRPGARSTGRVAGRIVIGWLLTLPAAARTAGVVYAIIDVLGDGRLGAIVVSVILGVACFLLWRANKAQAVEPEETISEHPTFGDAPAPPLAATMLADSIVDWGLLREAVYISVAVGLGVLVIGAIAVASSLRSQDERAAGHGGAASRSAA